MDKSGSKVATKQDYEEWMRKIHAASNVKKEEDEEEDNEDNRQNKNLLNPPYQGETKKGKSAFGGTVFWGVLFFVLAFLPRLFFVYFVSNPDNPGAGWFGDAYHHWQIAYLTKEVGLSHGFLRLWDLKGMEYFWGLLHPLILLIVFSLTGNVTVGLERAVTSFFGSVSVVLVFLICRKYWNTSVGVAAALFAALNPVGLFNDASGMVEPVGIPFLLLGVYLWPEVPLLSGLSFAIALMARAEYWVFSLFLVLAMVLFTKKVKSDKKFFLSLGFFVPVLIYSKYLLNYTSDPIYPFYQNYMANIFGTWQLKQVLEPADIQAKYLFLGILLVTGVIAGLLLWKRPRGLYFYLLGLGNWIFLGATFGVGAYIKSYMGYVWYVRFMILPYLFLGAVLAILLLYYLPKKIKLLRVFGWLLFLIVFLVFQLVWIPIWGRYSKTDVAWKQAVRNADGIAVNYHGGGLLLMDGNPEITYALVRFHDVQGRNIVGEMFDPYFYMSGDPYKNWGKNRKVVLHWLQQNNIRTIATYVQYKRYADLAAHEPEFFTEGVAVPNTNIVIYQVKDEFYQQKF